MIENWLNEEYDKFIEKTSFLDSKMIPIKLHLRGIVEYFLAKTPHSYNSTVNWFWIASSINSVDFDGIRYDCAFSMCRPAYEYEKEKQKLHIRLINELTSFLYVYSGFESFLNDLSLPCCASKNGKINSATFFLKENYSNNFNSIPLYSKLLCTFRELIKKSFLVKYERYFSIDNCTDINGVGLKVVYKIRNKLAHGDYRFPEPVDWSFELPLEPEITKIATRILLLSTQMLLISTNAGQFEELELYNSEIIEEDDEGEWIVNEFKFLNTFHLSSLKNDSRQLSLF
ncbi:hypothetical protein [Draconibacterium orientale]|uniref:hypothetical protein n=1 Tax=Draconibacterium orientale TaxID=1168034 RepID=UPI0029BFE91B|nr:hypothetical protein [Draconibacterium orientale]